MSKKVTIQIHWLVKFNLLEIRDSCPPFIREKKSSEIEILNIINIRISLVTDNGQFPHSNSTNSWPFIQKCLFGNA